MQDQREIELEKLKIHFGYCASFLLIVIICIATYKSSDSKDFTTYLGNAATMASLLLGLIAIFYSFISNDGLSRSLGNINLVSSDIKEARGKIGEYLDLTRIAGAGMKESSDQMQKVSQQVDESLASLTASLNGVKAQADALQTSITALPSRLDILETNVIVAAKALGEKQVSTILVSTKKLDDALISQFLARAPLTGDLLAYACVLSAQTKKPLSLPAFCVAIEEKLDAYMSGFLASMSAIQLLERDLMKNQVRVYQVKAVHPTLGQEARKYFTDFVDRTYKNDREATDKWLGKLAKVEALFD